MGRKPRYIQIFDGDTFHAMWQCHNNSFFLENHTLKARYYNLLLKYAPLYGVKIYSYSILSSHPHIMGYCSSAVYLSKFQQVVNTLIARDINSCFSRKGQAIIDRFKVVRIGTNAQIIATMLYIDLNPVEAGIVKHPDEYPWSSYHYYAHGQKDILITPAPIYLAMSKSPALRKKYYRELVRNKLKRNNELKEIENNIAILIDK